MNNSLTNIDRVSTEIKNVGLYDQLYQDIKEELNNNSPSIDDIKKLLIDKSNFLEEYKQINLEYNISNIHIQKIDISKVKENCKEKVKEFNKKLDKLFELEKYTIEFEKSSFLVIVFSLEFFVLFSVQYFIVLLSLKEYQWYIYALFLASVLVAWYYSKKEKEKYKRYSKEFYKIYKESLELLDFLSKQKCIDISKLWILESKEHI